MTNDKSSEPPTTTEESDYSTDTTTKMTTNPETTTKATTNHNAKHLSPTVLTTDPDIQTTETTTHEDEKYQSPPSPTTDVRALSTKTEVTEYSTKRVPSTTKKTSTESFTRASMPYSTDKEPAADTETTEPKTTNSDTFGNSMSTLISEVQMSTFVSEEQLHDIEKKIEAFENEVRFVDILLACNGSNAKWYFYTRRDWLSIILKSWKVHVILVSAYWSNLYRPMYILTTFTNCKSVLHNHLKHYVFILN